MLDYSCPPRAMRAAASVPCSSDLSLEMNTLAMKYVDSRQLMQRAAAGTAWGAGGGQTGARLTGEDRSGGRCRLAVGIGDEMETAVVSLME